VTAADLDVGADGLYIRGPRRLGSLRARLGPVIEVRRGVLEDECVELDAIVFEATAHVLPEDVVVLALRTRLDVLRGGLVR